MGTKIQNLPAVTPVRGSSAVVTDNGGSLATVAQMLALIQLTDLPSGSATAGQILMWSGTAWVPATFFSILVANLPSSPAALPTGSLWNNGGVLCVA